MPAPSAPRARELEIIFPETAQSEMVAGRGRPRPTARAVLLETSYRRAADRMVS